MENKQQQDQHPPSVGIITGCTGQDGSYLSEFLLEKGYHVHGLLRRVSTIPTERIEHLISHPNFHLHYCDITDSQNVYETMRKIEKREGKPPDEIYNLAAQSHVGVSFTMPLYTANVDAIGALNILNVIKDLEWNKTTKFYQASTSELFGSTPPPQNEKTPFHPRSPYAVAKLYAYWITIHHREAYNIFAINGILFNHESPRRGLNFVTRKVTRAVGQILRGELDCLYLGNLNAIRDWGCAKDYVRAMWLMMQQKVPQDMVIGTGKAYSVRDLVVKAFQCVKIDIDFENSGVEEIGRDRKSGKVLVKVDPKYFRPTEVENLLADPTFAMTTLNWKPTYTFDMLIEEMVKSDLDRYNHKY
jgi:GDPmannose 4,6-dehydratase